MDTNKIVIRNIEERDIDQVSTLVGDMWLQHAKEEPAFLDYDYIETYDTPSYIRKYMHAKNNLLLVAEVNEKIVGTARGEIIQSDEGMYKFKQALYLDDYSVDEKFRKQGIATLLTEKLLAFGKKNNVTVCYSKLYEFNTKSQNLFEKNGFKSVYRMYYKFK